MSKRKLILLIDGENLSSPYALRGAIALARRRGHVCHAVAIIPPHNTALQQLLTDEGVEILPRMAEMPKNAADAQLMMVAAHHNLLAQATGDVLTFVFMSNDNGFAGAAELLRVAGHTCWRIGTMSTRHSMPGFDLVFCVPRAPSTPPASLPGPVATPVPMPANLLPTTRMSLSAFADHMKRHFPELYASLRRFARRFVEAVQRFITTQHWPLVLERDGQAYSIAMAEGVAP